MGYNEEKDFQKLIFLVHIVNGGDIHDRIFDAKNNKLEVFVKV